MTSREEAIAELVGNVVRITGEIDEAQVEVRRLSAARRLNLRLMADELNMTNREIAAAVGMTQARVNQLLNKNE